MHLARRREQKHPPPALFLGEGQEFLRGLLKSG
jgi:hypothetical protein